MGWAHLGILAMASLFKRDRSPYWWLKFRDKTTGLVVRRSTGLRFDDASETRKARELRRLREGEEDSVAREFEHMRWDKWVVPFLEHRHSASPKTLTRKLASWSYLSEYLRTNQIATPIHLTRQHCLDYVDWRTAERPASINTVLLDLCYLGSIVQEAVRRQWVMANPCFRLGIARETPRQKAELSDSDIALIRQAIAEKHKNSTTATGKRNAEFLKASFEIAIAQGCRLFETHIDLDNIDTENMEITFMAKGRKRYTAPLSPTLLPFIEQLQKRKQRFTYEPPKMPSLLWWELFKDLRAKHPHLNRASFHSTRVTVISRLGRAGVPERVAMSLVNHSSTTVHRIYRRVEKSELSAVWKALNPLSSAAKRP